MKSVIGTRDSERTTALVLEELVEALKDPREIDQTAATEMELVRRKDVSRTVMQRILKRSVAAGKIEQVWKHDGYRVVKAYRPKRK